MYKQIEIYARFLAILHLLHTAELLKTNLSIYKLANLTSWLHDNITFSASDACACHLVIALRRSASV